MAITPPVVLMTHGATIHLRRRWNSGVLWSEMSVQHSCPDSSRSPSPLLNGQGKSPGAMPRGRRKQPSEIQTCRLPSAFHWN